MTRASLNLVMGGLIVAIGTGLYLSRETPEPEVPLLAVSEDAITRIEIAHPGQPEIVLRRDGEEWQLVAPVAARADAFEVASLTRLAGLPVRRDVAPEADRAALGLLPPSFEVRLNGQALAFGEREPLSSQRYLAVGERVVLVDNPPGSALDADYSDLVSKQLLPAEAGITRISLPGLTLIREDGRWQSPEAPEAPADQLLSLVEAWQNAQAMWNSTALEVDAAANETAQITLEDGRELLWVIARREPQFELIRPDLRVQHTLSRTLVETLLSLSAPPESPVEAPADSPE